MEYRNGITNRNNKKACKYFSDEDVQNHCTESDCWVSENGIVYDVTKFLGQHPGGADMILSHAGKDVTNILTDINLHTHSSNAYNLLQEYKIGILQDNTVSYWLATPCHLYTSCPP